ncbi:HNH endonuclease [Methanococcoides alaskense]|uniref:HNH restriction endonuclease n=1 Tax=Methanococcoides alaskense TaxID=325778 RepID=A0AA90TXH1_9EURY|nr:HNH endonuclease [Methanococcoides alaskense]MDA0525153.1 HNH endonuclease [Methanococcoides alaskense]MDR6221926.1 putative HNH restriction endonuclease [Methanococcoides alaskense]
MTNYWRMAFRWGNQGTEVWEQCRDQGIAAIGYYFNGEPVVGDCSEIDEKEFYTVWRSKALPSPTRQSSLKHVAYHMDKGDTIYAKEGTQIVGKGTVKSKYKYRPGIVKQKGILWEHYVEVDWDKNFKPFTLNLEANQNTVLKLDTERLDKIHAMESKTNFLYDCVDEIFEENEGEQYIKEAVFRKRNKKIIDKKKKKSDYRCEVCDMNYKEVYGEIGKNYIIAHHIEPIGSRDGSSPTTIDDIALVCSNCHNMIHKKKPPLSIEELSNLINK